MNECINLAVGGISFEVSINGNSVEVHGDAETAEGMYFVKSVIRSIHEHNKSSPPMSGRYIDGKDVYCSADIPNPEKLYQTLIEEVGEALVGRYNTTQSPSIIEYPGGNILAYATIRFDYDNKTLLPALYYMIPQRYIHSNQLSFHAQAFETHVRKQLASLAPEIQSYELSTNPDLLYFASTGGHTPEEIVHLLKEVLNGTEYSQSQAKFMHMPALSPIPSEADIETALFKIFSQPAKEPPTDILTLEDKPLGSFTRAEIICLSAAIADKLPPRNQHPAPDMQTAIEAALYRSANHALLDVHEEDAPTDIIIRNRIILERINAFLGGINDKERKKLAYDITRTIREQYRSCGENGHCL